MFTLNCLSDQQLQKIIDKSEYFAFRKYEKK